jgi:UDP-GlcNAc:undecaprenyl-phosphate/decaprenyl-phosphate GlcNAc-1-phosphate transferase
MTPRHIPTRRRLAAPKKKIDTFVNTTSGRVSIFKEYMMYSLNLFVAASLTAGCILLLSPWAELFRLLDRPGGRRIHADPTPRIGGIGILAGVVCAWALIPDARLRAPIAVGALLVVLVGLADDIAELRASIKFASQVVIASGTAIVAGLTLPYLGEVLPGVEITAPWLGLPLAVLAYASVMNALNMADGVDGLAGSLAVVAFMGLALAASMGGAPDAAWIALAPAAAIAGFLSLNARVFGRRCAAVFMGDTGSMLIGFLLATVAIIYTQQLRVVPPVVALWICALPLMDGLVVIVRRRVTGVPPTAPGCDHLHHLLRTKGWGVNAVVVIESALATVFAAVGLFGWQTGMPSWLLVLAFVGTLIGYAAWSKRAWRDAPLPGLVADAIRGRDAPQRSGVSP